VTALLLGLALAMPAAAQHGAAAAGPSLADLTADVVRTMRTYRDAVARSLPIHEATVREADAAVQERRRLHAAGALAVADLEAAERALGAAVQELEEAREALEEAERLLFEAELQQRLASLAPLPRGGFQDTAMLVRFNGAFPWSLAHLPALQQRFLAAFGRALPVSSLGQTRVHDRLGLDHREAIDVAVHPDSAEGRWLMQHLREQGIPFIGVRAAVPGASTGAHVHVGPESPRRLAR
jgi:hypothetical protein